MALSIYKKGQGNYTRLVSAFCLAIIAAIACYKVYQLLVDATWLGRDVNQRSLYASLIPAGVFAVIAFLIYRLVNKHSVADFMIASEGEMKKVSWSSREEIVASTFIVIIVVIMMAALLGITDLLFTMAFREILR